MRYTTYLVYHATIQGIECLPPHHPLPLIPITDHPSPYPLSPYPISIVSLPHIMDTTE